MFDHKIAEQTLDNFFENYSYLFVIDVVRTSDGYLYPGYEEREPGYAKTWLNAYNQAFALKLNHSITPKVMQEIQGLSMQHLEVLKGCFKNNANHFAIGLQCQYQGSQVKKRTYNPSTSLDGFRQLIQTWFIDVDIVTHMMHFKGDKLDVIFFKSRDKLIYRHFNKDGVEIDRDTFLPGKYEEAIKKGQMLLRDVNYECIVNSCPQDFITDRSTQAFTADKVADLCHAYNEQIVKDVTCNEKIKTIVKFIQSSLQLHPFADGNIRTCYILLNRLLVEEGLSMTLLANPYQLYGFSVTELVQIIKEGQQYCKDFLQGIVPNFNGNGILVPPKIGPENLYDAKEELATFIKMIKSETPKTGFLFFTPIPQALLKKYGLVDDSQPSLEKGLRRAAAKNNMTDLKLFIQFTNNMNAKDSNPTVGRTALHWAAEKGHVDCYHLLIENGADVTLLDANGRCAVLPETNVEAKMTV